MITFSHIIDISLPLTGKTIVYPGNPKVEIEEIKSASGNSTISRINFGSHSGTHIDAPKHSVIGGKTLDEIDISIFVGPCRVIDCQVDEFAVSLDTLKQKNIQHGERILLKTINSRRGYKTFYDKYVFVSPEAATYLTDKQVLLVGIDYLSIKQRGSPDNSPHTLLLEENIPIVEGIDLSQVDEGEYFLVILPLKFIGIDGSPARAVLLK